MKTYTNIITELNINSLFFEIDELLICEALKEKHLLELAKYLKKFKDTKINGWNLDFSFAGLFGNNNVAWDKITENDFEYYKAGDKKAIKMCRSILKNNDDFLNILCLLLNPDNNDEVVGMLTYGSVIMFNVNKTRIEREYDYEFSDYNEKVVEITPQKSSSCGYKQKEFGEFAATYDMMILDLRRDDITTTNKKRDRRESQQGMIYPGDPGQYETIAKLNIERYKNIIRKHKAERAFKEDNLQDKVLDILTKTMQISTKIGSDPIKYADCEAKIAKLLDLCYSQKRTHYGKNPTDTYTYGENGLLFLYTKYIKNTLSMAKNGGYEYQSNEVKASKTELKSLILKMNEMIEELEKLTSE